MSMGRIKNALAAGLGLMALAGAYAVFSPARAGKRRREQIREIVAQTLRADVRKVRPEARFVEDLGGHSLSLAECRSRIEEAFSLDIPDEDAQKLTTVGDVTAYVEAHVKRSK